MKKNNSLIFIIILSVASALTHFIWFGYPQEVVFDEVHFGKFISSYLKGEYFFDIHPPFAKLLIAGTAFLINFHPSVDFSTIGNNLADTNFIWLRLLPASAGFLLPLIIFFLCRELNLSRLSSFTAGALTILENSLVVQSRFVLLDSFILLFGFSALLFYFRHKKTKINIYLALSALLATFAFSTKWTGLSFLFLIIIMEFYYLITKKSDILTWIKKIGLLIFFPACVYFLIFTLHFLVFAAKSPEPTIANSIYAINNQFYADNNYDPEENTGFVLLKGIVTLNKQMLVSNKNIGAHPYGSQWYSWPLMQRPIYYWNKNMSDKQAKIYFLGNPFVYWLSALAVIFIITARLFKLDAFAKKNGQVVSFLLAGYLANLLPFIFISRVMFLYHYLTALIFAILLSAYLIDQIKLTKKRLMICGALILVTLTFFLYFSPLTYGLPMSNEDLEARFWFNCWR